MISIREIADLAGVSATTVSNVLHGHTKKVSPNTIEKVQTLLQEHNYISRLSLRTITSQSTRLIGVIMLGEGFYEHPLLTSFFYSQILSRLEIEIRSAGYFMMLFSSGEIDDIYRMAASWNVDGMIAVSFNENAYLKLRMLTGKPVVGIDIYGATGDDTYSVGLEDEEGAYKMTSFLIGSGYRDVCFFAMSELGPDYSRHNGYRRALEDAGLPYKKNNHIFIDGNREKRFKRFDELLSHVKRPCAWFFSADTHAIEALGYLQKLKCDLPDDIGVAGFDDEPYSSLVFPSLTTVHQDVASKSEAAFQMLLKLMEGRPVGEKMIKLPVSLVIRNSTRRGCPSR